MRIKLVIILYSISVIIRVSDPDSAVLEHLDIVIAVSYVEALYSSVGLYGPAQSSVLFARGKYLYNSGYKIVIVKAVYDHGSGFGGKLGKILDDRNLVSVFIQKRNVFISRAYGEKPSGLQAVYNFSGL